MPVPVAGKTDVPQRFWIIFDLACSNLDGLDVRIDRIVDVFYARENVADQTLGVTLTTGDADMSMMVEAAGFDAAARHARRVVEDVLADAGEDLGRWTIASPTDPVDALRS
ncbi:hypothetical protein [Protofrankia symbiont of Coriaria ruscifolia]|uniref:hypothetical protein n=1 Tax=Protofrankia symbiont of Coriaria ruscifolia TaxID=1306542 RepID=UPI001041850F|nr:hypothetical protein [Protofrankia symbiont of Coriaria ruscifolia]